MQIPQLKITVEDVLIGQGADPDRISIRRDYLFAIAGRAMEIGMRLIEPHLFHRKLSVESFLDNEILLEDGWKVKNSRLIHLMPDADHIYFVIATIGNKLEELSSGLFQNDISVSLAVDGLANAAVDKLTDAAYRQIKEETSKEGMQVSIPVGPGSKDWPLETGQPVIFGAVKPDPQIIRLTESSLMIPRKSNSFILGIGNSMPEHGTVCEYCDLRITCRYKLRKSE